MCLAIPLDLGDFIQRLPANAVLGILGGQRLAGVRVGLDVALLLLGDDALGASLEPGSQSLSTPSQIVSLAPGWIDEFESSQSTSQR